MSMLGLLATSILFAQGNPPATDPYYYVGQRVLYTSDGSFGTISGQQRVPEQVCVTFDVPRNDGAVVRCNISKKLLAAMGSVVNLPLYTLFVGLKVIYTPDGAFALVTAINQPNGTVCVSFDKARGDGKFDRCNIQADLLASTGTSYVSSGTRIIYTPDASYGTIIGINFYDQGLCIKFDRPRGDGVLVRCNISQSLVARAR